MKKKGIRTLKVINRETGEELNYIARVIVLDDIFPDAQKIAERIIEEYEKCAFKKRNIIVLQLENVKKGTSKCLRTHIVFWNVATFFYELEKLLIKAISMLQKSLEDDSVIFEDDLKERFLKNDKR